jgi:hypothetical protein
VQAEDVFRQETPAPPAELHLTGQGTAAVSLTWLDSAANESGYYVYRSTDNQNYVKVASLAADQSGYLDPGLTRHTQYTYQVTAWNSFGESQPVSITAQTGLLEDEPEDVITSTEVITPTSLPPVTTVITYTYDRGLILVP